MRIGAIILCGGKSSRMGHDKATLPFGPEQMLLRVVRLIGAVIEPSRTVVVASPDQQLPELPPNVAIGHDEESFHGPLQGMSAGFRALADRIDVAYVSGCDAPLLVPAFVRQMCDMIADFDIAVPFDGQHHYPLAAVYRRVLLPTMDQLLAAQQRSPQLLFEKVRTRRVPVDELRAVDPDLATLKNLNYEADYFAALASAGFRPEVGHK